MMMDERLLKMIEYMRSVNAARYTKIAKDLNISQSTARRDALILEKHGLVTKIYGGIMMSGSNVNIMPVSLRQDSHIEAKTIICKQAASLVQDRMSLFLYGSSTIMHIVPYLTHLKKLRILTNSAELCEQLTDAGMEVYCTGGRLRMTDKVYVGSYSEEIMSQFHPDISFFSPSALSLDGDLTSHRSESQSFLKLMIRKSKKCYALCDSSKVRQTEFFSICNAADIDGVFCEQELPAELTQIIGMNRCV